MGLLEKIFGSYSEKELKRIKPIVDEIEAMEPEIKKLSDAQLKGKHRNLRIAWPTEKHLMIFFRRLLPL